MRKKKRLLNDLIPFLNEIVCQSSSLTNFMEAAILVGAFLETEERNEDK
jgi:hypothetical protein